MRDPRLGWWGKVSPAGGGKAARGMSIAPPPRGLPKIFPCVWAPQKGGAPDFLPNPGGALPKPTPPRAKGPPKQPYPPGDWLKDLALWAIKWFEGAF